MKKIRPREVWFAYFPFADDPRRFKERPVIVLDAEDENCLVLSMKVTSTVPRGEYEITLYDWAEIPLAHESTAVASEIRKIPRADFRRKVGELSDDDWENVTDLYSRFVRSQGFDGE